MKLENLSNGKPTELSNLTVGSAFHFHGDDSLYIKAGDQNHNYLVIEFEHGARKGRPKVLSDDCTVYVKEIDKITYRDITV